MYKCPICSKIFISKTSYNEHLSRCENENRITDDEDVRSTTSSVSSYTVDNSEKINDKKALKEEIRVLLEKYEEKKSENKTLKKRLKETFTNFNADIDSLKEQISNTKLIFQEMEYKHNMVLLEKENIHKEIIGQKDNQLQILMEENIGLKQFIEKERFNISQVISNLHIEKE